MDLFFSVIDIERKISTLIYVLDELGPFQLAF